MGKAGLLGVDGSASSAQASRAAGGSGQVCFRGKRDSVRHPGPRCGGRSAAFVAAAACGRAVHAHPSDIIHRRTTGWPHRKAGSRTRHLQIHGIFLSESSFFFGQIKLAKFLMSNFDSYNTT